MSATPRFRNFLNHDFLIDAERAKPWTRQVLGEATCGAYANSAFIFVLSPTHQWVFIDDPEQFNRAEFCDWLEAVFAATINDRDAWPNLEFCSEPPQNWTDVASQMPCRTGPDLWRKLSRTELKHYVEGGDLPEDIDERGDPDNIQ